MFEVSSHFPSAAVPEKHNDGDFDSTSRNPQAEAAAAGRDLSFGWQMIRKAGAAAIVENLLAGEQISAGEFRVLSSLDFPLLAKIVEVVLTGAGPIPGSGTISAGVPSSLSRSCFVPFWARLCRPPAISPGMSGRHPIHRCILSALLGKMLVGFSSLLLLPLQVRAILS